MTDEALKLQRFKEAVSADVSAQAEQMLAEAKAESERIIKEAQTAAMQHDEMEHIRIRSKAEAEYTRKLSTSKLEAQRGSLIRREQLANEVFESVKSKLADFRSSKNYADWLIATVSACTAKYPDNRPFVRLAPEDMKYQPALGITAQEDKTIALGGAIVGFEGLSLVIDCTFDSMFEEERAGFCNNKELFAALDQEI